MTVIGTRKGKTLEENLRCNFGMPGPEGYRKALRLMKQAEKFGRPVITLIDTSGAYPGMKAEERGQGEAIARNLLEMSSLRVPVIAIITGEGNSGGALALAVSNRVLMLENAVYAILSPEGFASILWKDATRAEEACGLMKLTAPDLMALGVIDEIIPEPAGGAHQDMDAAIRAVDACLQRHLMALCREKGGALAANLSLILGAASVIIWLLLGTPFGIHVAIVGLPMAGLGYLIGMAVGDKPTEAQLKAITDAGMKVIN